MLVNAKEILLNAKKNKYAVAHFNINNLEWAKFILEQCELDKTPVILGVSEGATKYMGGYSVVSAIVKELIKNLNISVPVVLHLDHGSSYESCVKAIESGFTSVMIDASKYSLDKNIEITKKVTLFASKYNVTVEAEIGKIGGNEDGNENDIVYADPDECMKLVSETNIDFLAPALGSVHGIYKGEPKLDFVKMEKIAKENMTPLVLHGGSGIPDWQIKKAIECGISKININTELQIVWSKAVRLFLNSDEKVYDPRKIIKAGEKAIKEEVRNKNILLGSYQKV
ncbi:MAG: class II fructose-1,6-bisphosphate aldolase [Bacilli bacterium]|nr:class II fructose-1,6-bisphosphate aldolase [Bacilli bacterium]